jgi:hypothetical protein
MITAMRAWIEALANPAVQLATRSRGESVIQVRGRRQLLYYFAREWMMCYLSAPTAAEIQQLRDGLDDPASVEQRGDRLRFHATVDADFALIKAIIEARLAAGQ